MELYNKIIDLLLKQHSVKEVNDFMNCGTSGIYLALCGETESFYSFKPGITNTNIFDDTLFNSKEISSDYLSILKQIFKSSAKPPSTSKEHDILKQFKSRNGKPGPTSITNIYESKEHNLPIIQRYITSIPKALFIESLITLINSQSITFSHDKSEILNDKYYLLTYNGYALKSLYPSKSGNINESVLFDKGFRYHLKFKDLLLNQLKPLNITLFQHPQLNEIDKLKWDNYYSFYSTWDKKYTKICLSINYIFPHTFDLSEKDLNSLFIKSENRYYFINSKDILLKILKFYPNKCDIFYNSKVNYSPLITNSIIKEHLKMNYSQMINNNVKSVLNQNITNLKRLISYYMITFENGKIKVL